MRIRRHAFTIVELLVVIAIISMLVAITVPAVNSARESARRMKCASRLRQLGMAINVYENQRGRYPTMNRPWGTSFASWVITMLPYLDEEPLFQSWHSLKVKQTPLSKVASEMEKLPRPHLPLLVCPTDGTVDRDMPAISYMANQGPAQGSGRYGKDYNVRELGIFLEFRINNVGVGTNHMRPGRTTSLAYIQEVGDGASKTLLLSENIQLVLSRPVPDWQGAGGSSLATRWDLSPNTGSARVPPVGGQLFNCIGWNFTTTPTPAMRINGDLSNKLLSSETARPASFHPRGVNAVFCDGRVAFLSEDISYRHYIQMMMPRDAGLKKYNRNFARELGELSPLPSDVLSL